MTASEQDLRRVEAKIDAVSEQLAALVSSQQRTHSLYDEMAPIATQALGVGAERLHDLEQRGYFDFGREALHVVDKVIAGYTPEDVHELGDQVVRILGLVRRITQPDVLNLAEVTADAAQDAGQQDPPGVLGILKATQRDEEVRRGLMVVVSVLRQIGLAAHKSTSETSLATINPLLGGQRNLTRAPAAAPAPAPTQAPEPVAARQLAGVDITADGFIERSDDWTPAIGALMAETLGVSPLTDRHLKVIDFARSEYEQTGASPNIRRITSGSGVPTKELYALFPRAPAKTAAKIAGIPKPVGCI